MDGILDIFRALADPTRLRIMLLLQKMELAVGELAQILGQSQPRISRHIRILVEAGLAERHKEGSWVFLRPGSAAELEILNRIFRSDNIATSKQAIVDEQNLAIVRNARAKMAEDYFATHAEEWDAIRSLHIADEEVEKAMIALLKDAQIGHLLDIGTGTGRMVELFGEQASEVTAVDKSPEMLRLTRAKLLEHDELVGKTDLKQGDFNRLPVDDVSVNTTILHQVLHYAQQPEAVLQEVNRVLKRKGLLLVADFAAHDREELRTEHAHARLGFSEESMKRLFSSAGLDLEQSRTLEGGKLKVKIWFGRKSGLPRINPDPMDFSKMNITDQRASA